MRFTSLNAREMAARSVAARKAAEAERNARAASALLQATPPTDTDPGISVACVRERLEAIDGLMCKAKDSREWDNLTRAYDRMFKVLCVLTKTPGPGNRRPVPERRSTERRVPWAVEPACVPEPAPTPQEPSACGVEPAG